MLHNFELTCKVKERDNIMLFFIGPIIGAIHFVIAYMVWKKGNTVIGRICGRRNEILNDTRSEISKLIRGTTRIQINKGYDYNMTSCLQNRQLFLYLIWAFNILYKLSYETLYIS